MSTDVIQSVKDMAKDFDVISDTVHLYIHIAEITVGIICKETFKTRFQALVFWGYCPQLLYHFLHTHIAHGIAHIDVIEHDIVKLIYIKVLKIMLQNILESAFAPNVLHLNLP